MKGVILETSDYEAAVLYNNGIVSKIKNRHYVKGQVVKMNNNFKFMAKAGSIAAALALTAVTGFAYTTPSTYVSLDVNPSIEYELNAFDRVISVVAVNDDGEKIVDELDVKNEKIQKAILNTVEKLEKEGYLTEEEYAGIVIAISNKDEEKSEQLTKDIKDEINKYDESLDAEDKEESEDQEIKEDEEKDIQIVVEAVGSERVEEARKLNVTPGKLNLVQKLIASTDDFDDIDEEQLQELLELSVKEINKMTKAYRKDLDIEFVFEEDDLEEEKEDEIEKTKKAIIDKDDIEDDNNDKDDKENKKENKKEKSNKIIKDNEQNENNNGNAKK